jgi:two-component system sensor kinase FixL
MGLSICRTIISAHGGHLSNANNADHGTSFEFTLPAHAEMPKRVDTATA